MSAASSVEGRMKMCSVACLWLVRVRRGAPHTMTRHDDSVYGADAMEFHRHCENRAPGAMSRARFDDEAVTT